MDALKVQSTFRRTSRILRSALVILVMHCSWTRERRNAKMVVSEYPHSAAFSAYSRRRLRKNRQTPNFSFVLLAPSAHHTNARRQPACPIRTSAFRQSCQTTSASCQKSGPFFRLCECALTDDPLSLWCNSLNS